MLSDLAGKIAQTPAPPKDQEAEEFIRTNIGKRPDALYLMTQTVLIQNMALEQAQRQLRDLQARGGQASAAAGGGSFLGGQPSGYGQGTPYASQPQYAQPQYGQSFPNQGGAPSFLRGAAQTAAGVAAGALAFEGIRSLFSHPGYGGEHGFGDYGSGFGGETVNNYYEGDGGASDLSLGDNRDTLADDYTNVSDSNDFGGFDDGGGFDGGSDDNFA